MEERYTVAGRDVTTAALEEAAATVRAAVERLVDAKQLEGPPTFFECATAIAFELFRRQQVDVAVLEVGLGGRLDATNVVTPIAVAITSIDFDHEAQLGNTLEAIAREKAGVIRPGLPVVCGILPEAAWRVIEEACATVGARLVRAADLARAQTLPLRLAGRHQTANAAVALCLLDELDRLGVSVDGDAVWEGFRGVEWPGRLERFTYRGADVLMDAAHNPAGARALAAYIRESGWIDPTLVFGAMRDKDVEGMVGALAPVCGALVCTTAPSPRALPAQDLVMIARALTPPPAHVTAQPDPVRALAEACRPGARVVIAGSIFLIGLLRGILR
ncbi:MAG: bifunctional folylpolyglutamate synthase/dihydrofolate synthase [Acidobacteria bacterium]|nr:bifunctional folylpolyglutamate synthase/dihydrofolate synthase [Acidobacteriota bacterium]